MNNYRKDIISGIVIAVLDAAYIFFAGDITPFLGKGASPITNRFFPYLWGCLLMALSIVLIVRGFVHMKKEEKDKEQSAGKKVNILATIKDYIVDNREVIMSFSALFIYILLLKSVGFLIMTFVYLTLQILILTKKEKRNYVLAIIVGFATSIILYLIFAKVLHILLPAGILHF